MTTQPIATTTANPAFAKLDAAHRSITEARKQEDKGKQDRANAIADLRLAGVPVKTIADRIAALGGEPLGAARVQQVALKVLGERGVKAPRGKKEGTTRPTLAATKKAAAKKAPAKKAASSRSTTKAPAKKAAAKKTAAPKATVRPGTVTGDKA